MLLRLIDKSKPRHVIQVFPVAMACFMSAFWHGFYFGFYGFFSGLVLINVTWKMVQ